MVDTFQDKKLELITMNKLEDYGFWGMTGNINTAGHGHRGYPRHNDRQQFRDDVCYRGFWAIEPRIYALDEHAKREIAKRHE